MSIGKRTYPKSVLPPRAWKALHVAVAMVMDELVEDIRSDAAPEELSTTSYLPAKYLPQYTAGFMKQFLVCVTVVSWKLFDKEHAHRLDCLAEELALNAILRAAEGILELDELDGATDDEVDFSLFEDVAFEDTDFESLFDPSEDGIEDTVVGEQLGMTNLKFKEWFLPFSEGFRVHPYFAPE